MLAKNKIIAQLSNNYNYSGAEYDYSSQQNCDGGCQNGDYCRCTTIEDAHITKAKPQELLDHIVDVLSSAFKGEHNPTKNPVNVYAIGRLLIHHKFDDVEYFNVGVTGGYYGEEISDVTHDNHAKFIQDLVNVLSLNSNTSKIEYLLNLEYGHIPEQYKNLDWETKDIAIDNINYIEQQMMLAGKDNTNNKYPLDAIQQAILCTENGAQFNLVDGYHRLNEKIAKKNKNTPAICGRKRSP